MGFFKENKHANGTTSTDWGGSIAGGFGGVEGIAVAFMVFIGAIVGGGFALLWFAITGYKKFNLGKVSRIIALGLSIVYAFVVYITFASGKPILLVYANIPIALFFLSAYMGGIGIGRMSRKKFWIYFFILLLLLTFSVSYYPTVYTAIIFSAPIIYISIMRLHDIGKSGWWILVPSIFLIKDLTMQSVIILGINLNTNTEAISQVIGLIIWIYLLIKKGEESRNQFGEVVA